MQTSDAGRALVIAFEGLVPYAYNDPAGHATFGVGHLLHHGPCTEEDYRKFGRRGRQRPDAVDRAKRILREDLREFERGVSGAVRSTTRQREFDAMVSLAFNIGLGAFKSSTVLREHNARHPRRAGAAFLLWVFAGGVKFAGLVRRRTAERRMYRGRPWR